MRHSPLSFSKPMRLLAALMSLAYGFAAHAEVVVVVGRNSKLFGMTIKEVEQLYLAKNNVVQGISLRFVTQPEGRKQRDDFNKTIVDKNDTEVQKIWARSVFTGKGLPPLVEPNDTAVKAYLLSHPDAVGFIDSVNLDNSVRIVCCN